MSFARRKYIKEESEEQEESVVSRADRTNWLKFEIEFSNYELKDYIRRDKKKAVEITKRKIESLRDELELRTGNRNDTVLPFDCPVNISSLFYEKPRRPASYNREENSMSDDDYELYSDLINKKIIFGILSHKDKNYKQVKERIEFLEDYLFKKEEKKENNVVLTEDAPF